MEDQPKKEEEQTLEAQAGTGGDDAKPEMVERTVQAQPPEPPPALAPLSSSSARTWAMLAHLSILLNLFTGFLGPVAALVIYLAYKDRSRYIAYQSMQSFVFQLVFFVGAGILAVILWVITIPLILLIIGCGLAPFSVLVSIIPLVAIVYGVIGALQTSQGDDFRYWMVGDWVLPKEGSPGSI